jgi:hypothetical protein
MKILAQICTGYEKGFNDKHIPLLQEVLEWSNTLKRTFKRITDRMPCRAWKALFQEKENKNKEEELAKLERKKEREKEK